MVDRIISEILNIKWLIITFAILGVVLYFANHFLTSKFGWNKLKVFAFSALYGLSNAECAYVGTLITKLVYTIYLAINCNNITVEYLIPFIFMAILMNVLIKDIGALIIGVIGSVSIYAVLYLQSSLRYFYGNVEQDPMILVMVILLCIFTILYAVFSFISSYNSLIVNNNANKGKPVKQSKLAKLISKKKKAKKTKVKENEEVKLEEAVKA